MKMIRKKVRKFTIVELLIVVSIIAILFSFLLPALGVARGKARNLSCMNSMKSLGCAGMMYANANGDVWVPYNGGGNFRWFQNPDFHEALGAKTYPAAGEWALDLVRKNFLCPESARPLAEDDKWIGSGWSRLSFTYAMQYTDGDLLPGRTTDEFRYFRLNKIRSASRKIAFCETTQSGRISIWKLNPEDGFWKTGNNSGSEWYAAYRHNRNMSMNTAFFDGHVENRNYKTLIISGVLWNINKMQWFPYDNWTY